MEQAVAQNNDFQEDPPRRDGSSVTRTALILDIDGYEGPIEILLDLARRQKVDLAQISILQLVRQYLAFIEDAKARNLELAAEYLVMAAWLAYLKSRLLVPGEDEDDEPSAEEMADALQFQLRRLEAMQNAAEALRNRPQLGQTIFARGAPEGLKTRTQTEWQLSLYDMLRAYGDIQLRRDNAHYDLPPLNVMSTEDAFERLGTMLGRLPRKGRDSVWTTLTSLLPESAGDRLYMRSALASTLTAGLEMVKQGSLEMKQDRAFRPIYLRQMSTGDGRGGEEHE